VPPKTPQSLPYFGIELIRLMLGWAVGHGLYGMSMGSKRLGGQQKPAARKAVSRHMRSPKALRALTRVLLLAAVGLVPVAASAAEPQPAPAPELTAPDAAKADATAAAAADTKDTADTAAPSAAAPRARTPRSPQHRTPGQALDADVRRLTKQLDLNPDQQARLKELLIDQQRQIRRVWKDNPNPEADRVGPTMAIVDRTRAQIRAMLTDEQLSKYPAAVPRDNLGPATTDVDSWLQKIHSGTSRPRNAPNPPNPPNPPK
jgi:pyruvate/2-oxoglutarate dehydrogenase complex dihydrolipoamide acyltransferase (E2) component